MQTSLNSKHLPRADLKATDGVVVVRDEFPPPKRSPTPKQEDFWRACNGPAEEILFDGAIRSGKTQAACKMIASWAWQYGGPNWRFAIMRKTYRELEDSTKAAFLRGDGKMPPACPTQLIASYRKADEQVILRNGAEILFRSAENPADTEDKIRNVTLAGFFIDQIEELEGDGYFQLYETLISRCSDPRGPRKALLVANPGPEDHWVYKRFVDEHRREPWCDRISVTLYDNEYNLPDSYIRSMERRKETNPQWYKRFILGEWGAFAGKRFPAWDPKLHVVEPFTVPHGWEIVVGIDYGWSNPTAFIWCAIDYEGNWWVISEYGDNERPISHHAKLFKQRNKDLELAPSSIWLDPSCWAARSQYESAAAEFHDWGVEAARAQNDRLGGWNRIEEMLVKGLDEGTPQLRIFSTCQNLIRELPNLRIQEGTDDVEKVNDHYSDALRYAIMSRMPTPIDPDTIEEDDIWDGNPWQRMERRVVDKDRGPRIQNVLS